MIIKQSPWLHPFFIAFWQALAFLFLQGYAAFSGDQEELVPYLMALMNPDLYPTDYLVQHQLSVPGIRYFTVHFMSIFAFFLPIPLVLFLLHLACIMLSARAFSLMLPDQPFWRLTGPLVPLCLFHSCTLGANDLMDIQFTGTSLALTLSLWALYFSFRKRPLPAFLLAGLATWFQILVGLQFFALMTLALLLVKENHKNLKLVMVGIGLFLVVALPQFILVGATQFSANERETTERAAETLFFFRTSHHYNPACFPLSDYIRSIAVWGLAFLLGWNGRKRVEVQFLFLLLGLSLAGILLTNAAYYLSDASIFWKLQPFKLSVWATWVSAALILWGIESRGWGVHISFLNDSRVLGMLPLSATVLCVLIFFPALFPYDKLSDRYRIGYYRLSDLSLLHRWMDQNLPADSRVLSFPGDESILSEAKRSMPIGWKALSHEPDYLVDWQRKIQEVYGIQPTGTCTPSGRYLDEAYARQADSRIPEQYAIDYRIWDASIAPLPDNSQVLFKSGNYTIHRFAR